ncbi:MAG TPA: type II toxin-antitoxin system VapC family toxin [Dehalococcoidia bacterium]|nr:type II toxin-antitoxin system VapC family toxin [Dehalococcoidia bacterium]
MILYQDSDSICKRYLHDEEGIAETARAVEEADVVATSALSYAEVKGVLSRARKGRRISTEPRFKRVSEEFETDWRAYFQVAVSTELIVRACDLATKHALTGIDAIHLASAITLRGQVPDVMAASTWDKQLAGACIAENLTLAHEVS